MVEGREFPWPGLFEAIPGKMPVQQRVKKGLVLNAKAQSHLEQKMTGLCRKTPSISEL